MSLFNWTSSNSGSQEREAHGLPDVERAVERLSDDETLRGDLTDYGFGPLFAVVSELAVARAERFGSTDELYLALRRLLVASVEAAETRKPAALLEGVAAPLFEVDERAAVEADPGRLEGTADEVAIDIARAVAEATGVELEG
ncbi:MAG: hypothetical protein M1358_16410 [Chloroflexi bacterium]|nr:hypothetical protein [Chloroflexota bacterium]